jgi:arylsulfatase
MKSLLTKPHGKKPFFLTVSFFATHAQDKSPGQCYPMNSNLPLHANEPVPVPENSGQDSFQLLLCFIGPKCEACKWHAMRHWNATRQFP